MASMYEKGEKIRSLDELMQQEFIFHNHKVLHFGWFQSWPIRTAANGVKNGHYYKAVKKNEEDNEKWKSR